MWVRISQKISGAGGKVSDFLQHPKTIKTEDPKIHIPENWIDPGKIDKVGRSFPFISNGIKS